MIGYSDQESSGSRLYSDFNKESNRFRVELRSTNFLNPFKNNFKFESLDGNYKLSEALKSFSITAQTYRINYIKKN
jgi:hypothetical protein